MNLKRWKLPILALMLMLLVASCGQSPGLEAEPEPEATEETAAENVAEAEPSEAESSEAGPAPAEGMRTFVIVPEESNASYIVQEEFLGGALAKLGINAGNVEVTGTSDDVAGQLELDLGGDNPLGANEFRVNLSKFVTDQDRRDNWIRENGPNLGSAPPARFVAASIDGAPADYTDGQEVTFTLNGDLTIKETTHPVSFSVTATLAGDTITGSASAPSKLTDWGIEPPNFANTLTVADEFEIKIDFTAKE